ncbi:hypothetical protein L3X38_025453 [Prunus dulcis]|uniref:Uncharacterized protein n=1 Tax=Prunus dulcis TaxID=3755 RepID=A0AAD4Z729_PRUDU|nr:hypothetical protein L3X38_025453 [Prunus dulcis]
MKDDTLSMTMLGETTEFNVFDPPSQPSISVETYFAIDIVNDAIKVVISQEEEDHVELEFQEVVAALEVFQPYPPLCRPPLETLGPFSTKLEPSNVTPMFNVAFLTHMKKKKRKKHMKRRKRRRSWVNYLAMHKGIDPKPP